MCVLGGGGLAPSFSQLPSQFLISHCSHLLAPKTSPLFPSILPKCVLALACECSWGRRTALPKGWLTTNRKLVNSVSPQDRSLLVPSSSSCVSSTLLCLPQDPPPGLLLCLLWG